MRARDEGERVVVELSVESELATYLKPLNLLHDARDAYEAHRTDWGSKDLRGLEDAVDAAEEDVQYALSETLSIREAEFLCRQLDKAILRAKINRGDFVYEDVDA